MNKITKQNDRLIVPDKVTIPFIEGDGVGAEITPVSQKIVNAAIEKAYGGRRSIEWKEVLAGEKAFNQTGSWLPDETMDAFREYMVGIKSSADYSHRRRYPFPERGFTADTRPVRLPASRPLV